jgi:hypothetical protein
MKRPKISTDHFTGCVAETETKNISGVRFTRAYGKMMDTLIKAHEKLYSDIGHESDLPERISMTNEQYYEMMDSFGQALKEAGVES